MALKREVLEAATRIGLWLKKRKMKKKFPTLEVIEKPHPASCNRTKQSYWWMVVRYNENV